MSLLQTSFGETLWLLSDLLWKLALFPSALPHDITWLCCDSVCFARLDRVLFKHQLMTGKFFKDCATPLTPHASLRQYQADQSVQRSTRRNLYVTTFISIYFTDAHAGVLQGVWYAKSCFPGFSNSFPPPPHPRVPLHVSLKASLGCPINTVAERVKASPSWLLPSALVMNRHLWHRLLQNAEIFWWFLCYNHCYWITAASVHFPWFSPKYDLLFWLLCPVLEIKEG